MRCFYVYNPKSGRGKVLNKLKIIKTRLEQIYDEVVIYESLSADDLKESVKAASAVYDVIVFSGGDGTFNNVASALSSCSRRPILGYLPLGTTNDIARNLKIPRNVKKALKVIEQGVSIKHDVGKINDDYFIYVAAIGACTSTSYTTDHQLKKALGRLAYAWDAINQFFTAPVNTVKITTEDQVVLEEAPLMLVMNSVSIAGMRMNRYGHLNDGTFDIIVVKNGKDRGRLNMIWLFIAGMFGFKRPKTTISLKSSKFTIEIAENATWCIDGERGPRGVAHIENIHNHLSIFVPKSKLKNKNQENEHV